VIIAITTRFLIFLFIVDPPLQRFFKIASTYVVNFLNNNPPYSQFDWLTGHHLRSDFNDTRSCGRHERIGDKF
jgi:hypothetical protein